jgi:hypothetical protein
MPTPPRSLPHMFLRPLMDLSAALSPMLTPLAPERHSNASSDVSFGTFCTLRSPLSSPHTLESALMSSRLVMFASWMGPLITDCTFWS